MSSRSRSAERPDLVVEAGHGDPPVLVVQRARAARPCACSGLGTAPPNEPECRSTAGPRRLISASARPRMAITALGRSRAAMPVSLTTTTSQASRSVRSCEQGGEVRRAGLLLALDQQLEVDGGGVAAGGGEVGAHAEQVEGDLALVVDGAAGVQLGAVRAVDDGRLERRVHPQLRRVDRLHVVVAVDERDGCVRVGAAATRRRPRARRRSARPRRSGSRCGAAPRPASRRCRRRRRRAPGRRRSTGCAARRRGRRAGRRGGRGRSRALRWARLLLTGTDGSAALASTPCRDSCCGSTSAT